MISWSLHSNYPPIRPSADLDLFKSTERCDCFSYCWYLLVLPLKPLECCILGSSGLLWRSALESMFLRLPNLLLALFWFCNISYGWSCCCCFRRTFERLSNILSQTEPSLDLKWRGSSLIDPPIEFMSPLIEVEPFEPSLGIGCLYFWVFELSLLDTRWSLFCLSIWVKNSYSLWRVCVY